ncbi:uncharacterized protein AMSG_06397 [Thecamonas trahens ATCC 50062]|uniref:PH domain-containing protein n=1 Tax=Thecamonas trahens ATCC 50062 TaxID=461836 RepID=A0A0L0DD22_THETB|nr:hypothetical protein AMSG_06397 [Thecamonas trahens ATCC 50062]KNC50242.1 hypothetical protein AMSG_06397 [Thecamonas trahens ATCC 50062]|eukprot:XP_013757072.1 hypothetical protein AMSG_06397 [Thecamonas trahens ATCC 50062]
MATIESLTAEKTRLKDEVKQLKAGGAPPEEINPVYVAYKAVSSELAFLLAHPTHDLRGSSAATPPPETTPPPTPPGLSDEAVRVHALNVLSEEKNSLKAEIKLLKGSGAPDNVIAPVFTRYTTVKNWLAAPSSGPPPLLDHQMPEPEAVAEARTHPALPSVPVAGDSVASLAANSEAGDSLGELHSVASRSLPPSADEVAAMKAEVKAQIRAATGMGRSDEYIAPLYARYQELKALSANYSSEAATQFARTHLRQGRRASVVLPSRERRNSILPAATGETDVAVAAALAASPSSDFLPHAGETQVDSPVAEVPDAAPAAPDEPPSTEPAPAPGAPSSSPPVPTITLAPELGDDDDEPLAPVATATVVALDDFTDSDDDNDDDDDRTPNDDVVVKAGVLKIRVSGGLLGRKWASRWCSMTRAAFRIHSGKDASSSVETRLSLAGTYTSFRSSKTNNEFAITYGENLENSIEVVAPDRKTRKSWTTFILDGMLAWTKIVVKRLQVPSAAAPFTGAAVHMGWMNVLVPHGKRWAWSWKLALLSDGALWLLNAFPLTIDELDEAEAGALKFELVGAKFAHVTEATKLTKLGRQHVVRFDAGASGLSLPLALSTESELTLWGKILRRTCGEALEAALSTAPYTVSGTCNGTDGSSLAIALDGVTIAGTAVPWRAIVRYAESLATITITVVLDMSNPDDRTDFIFEGDEASLNAAFNVLTSVVHLVVVPRQRAARAAATRSS